MGLLDGKVAAITGAGSGMGKAGYESQPRRATVNPLGRPGAAEGAGELAAFLASDRAAYLNGVLIPLDGGWGAMLA